MFPSDLCCDVIALFLLDDPANRASSSDEIRTRRPCRGTMRIVPALIRRLTVRMLTLSAAATSGSVKKQGCCPDTMVFPRRERVRIGWAEPQSTQSGALSDRLQNMGSSSDGCSWPQLFAYGRPSPLLTQIGFFARRSCRRIAARSRRYAATS
jgi:hypothetical protein